jgi:hypothetical protein
MLSGEETLENISVAIGLMNKTASSLPKLVSIELKSTLLLPFPSVTWILRYLA